MQNKYFDYFKTDKFNKIFNTVLFCIYIILILTTIFHHELWRDEAQAWLVVRDLNISGIIHHVKTEGHPLLWYVLLFPLAKLHLPVFSMQLLSFLLAATGAAIFLFLSPFNKPVKISVIFSAGFLYWYSVIARSYSLIVPLLLLCAYFYPERIKKPYIYTILLILLSNTHVLMFGFSVILSVLFIFELFRSKHILTKTNVIFLPAVYFINFLLITIYILAGKQENLLVQTFINTDITGKNIINTFLSVFFNIYAYTPILFIILLIVFFFILLAILLKNDKKIFLTVFAGIAFQLAVYRYIWHTSPEKASLVLLILLFGFWIIFAGKNIPDKKRRLWSILITPVFLFTWITSFAVVKNDIKKDYSGSKKAAEFILKNTGKNAVFISNYNLTTAGISAYLPQQKFYFPQEKSFYTYSKWNNGLMKPFNSFVDYSGFKKQFNNKKIYFIFSFGIYIPYPPAEIKKVYESPVDVLINTEKFYIYELQNNE